MVIEIDHLEGAALPTAVGQLLEDEYVFAYWLSPSGEGLKGLVRISGEERGMGPQRGQRAEENGRGREELTGKEKKMATIGKKFVFLHFERFS